MGNSLKYDMAPQEERIDPCLCGDTPEICHTKTIMEACIAGEEAFVQERDEWILRCMGCGMSTVVSRTREGAVYDWNTFMHRWGVKE